MKLIKIFAFILVAVAGHGQGEMRCYSCMYSSRSGGANSNCKTDPTREPLQLADESQEGQKAYCLTEMKTENGTIRVTRSVYYAERRDLDGKCDEGPMVGKDPETNYVKSCYCASDACNKIPYTEPPKVESAIKCYVCGSEDPNCEHHVDQRYLVAIPTVPFYIKSRAVSTAIFPGFNIMGVREAGSSAFTDGPKADKEWTSYCMTTIIQVDGGVEINRNATWSHATNLSGKCEKSQFEDKVEHCYCNDRDGCNNKNGGNLIQTSAIMLIITNILLHSL